MASLTEVYEGHVRTVTTPRRRYAGASGFAAGTVMVVVGILGALVAPATMALVSDLAAPQERGVSMGGFNVFGSLGFLTGIVGGATVAGAFGFQAAIFAVGFAEIAIAIVLFPVLLQLEVPVGLGESIGGE